MARTISLGTCTFPGCGATCRGGRCERHPRPKRNRSGADPRPYKKREYLDQRLAILTRDPICKICNRFKSEVVDHKDGDNTNNKPENLQGACIGCNTKKGSK